MEVAYKSDDLLQRSWQRAWSNLRATPTDELFDHLIAAYGEPHRRYHTLQHLIECIGKLEPSLALATHPGEVEVALWFHDAIYDPKAKDNELRSAEWAQRALAAAGLPAEVCTRVSALVMATCHAALPATTDEGLLVDVDLAILGEEPARFAEYEAQVREEYAWVPGWLFRRRRKALLREFLNRPHIYSTEAFRNQYEGKARHNLQQSVR